jgi:hypothetical protein
MITGQKLDIPHDLLQQYPVLKDIIDKIKSGQLDLFGEEESPTKPEGSDVVGE